MITETDNPLERNDDRTTLVWSLLVSGFVNLMLWMLVAWGVALRMQAIKVAQDHPEETFMVSSSSVHIAQHSHPVPQQEHPSPLDAQKSQQQQPKKAQREAATPQPNAQPTELAKIVPNASPQPHAAPKQQKQGTLAEQLAQQQVAFQHEAQQLNSHNAPLSVATIDPAQRESATRQYQLNMSGRRELQGPGEGILSAVLARWIDRGRALLLHPVHLAVSDRRQEVANVPWPFCYPPTNDPIARGERHILILPPPPGYQLPAGTVLYPIEKRIYDYWLAHQ